MPRRTIVKEFPFLEGEHAEVDAKILPDGYLTRAKNVRLRKDGRFGVRADFDAIGTDTLGAGAFRSDDLIGFNDGLLAIGDSAPVAGDTTPWDLARYTGTAQIDWSPTAQNLFGLAYLGTVTGIRTIGGERIQSSSITRYDCAAAGGLVCLAFQVTIGFAYVRILRATDGATLLETVADVHPRVVAVGSAFYLFGFDAGNAVTLAKFDPATDETWQSLGTLTGTGISVYDVCVDYAGTGLWVATNKTTATSLFPVTTAGVVGSAITGPAVVYDYVTVRETASRVHLLTVLAIGTCQLRSYTTGGSLSTGPTTIVATSDRQPGMSDATTGGVEQVGIAVEQTATLNSVYFTTLDATTHGADIAKTWVNSFLGTKPLTGGAANNHHLFGGVMTDGSFFSNFLGDPGNQIFGAYQDKFAAAQPSVDHTPQLAYDASTGKCYWPHLTVDASGTSTPAVTEFSFATNVRRQTAQIGGQLYIGGGVIELYDGLFLVESGFFEKPRIVSATPSNGAGSLPSSTPLLLTATWEFEDALGRFHTSDLADVLTVTMGASDDTITAVATLPHGLRLNPTTALNQGLPQLVFWRSITGINQLRRCETDYSGPQASVSVSLLESDDTVRQNGIVYTQAARGALSGVVPHEGAPPADYLWKFGSRLLAANADQAQVSKELFPGEPICWSGAVGFLIPKISERITGVAALDQRGLLFTAEHIYQFAGDGPDDGGAGSYSEPSIVPGSTGLATWQSLVETPIGLFFQGSNGQLWVLPRDGSPPVWMGQPVRDTLAAFPVVTSATLVTEEQLVSFTCNDALGTDSRVVHYDLRAKTWIVDEFTSATPIASATSYQGRLAILSAGIAYTERTSLTPNAFLAHGLTTGRVDLDGAGWRKFATVGFLGEYRGDCNLQIRISYDDGKTFPDSKTFPLLASAGFSVGDTVDREWSPLRRKAEHIKLDFQAVTAGSATEGLAFNKWWVAFLPERGTSRSPAAQRG